MMFKTFNKTTAGLTLLAMAAIAATATSSTAFSDENFELNPAQKLIYENNHLSQLETGNEIVYEFVKESEVEGEEGFTDTVTVQVVKAHEDERKDVAVDFMTGERNIPFQDFTRFRGNPVIMAVLERDVSEMKRITQGGAIYFRNRIRYALAEDPAVDEVDIEVDGKKVAAAQVVIKPYVNDAMIQRFPMFENKQYKLVISDNVPGGVFEISTLVPKLDGEGVNIVESLRYKSTANNP